MKLIIKDKYFQEIKEGSKIFEYRDAHITFVNEDTGKKIRKEVIGIDLITNKMKVEVLKEEYPDCFEDDVIMVFELK